MRRRSDKEIKKEFNIFLVLGIIAILFGIFFVLEMKRADAHEK